MPSLGFSFQAMSSGCEIRLEGPDDALLGLAAGRAIEEVRRIEQKYSRYRPDSIVSVINAGAGCDEPVAVDAETASLLDFAQQLHTWSDGLFDITSGILRKAWDFKQQRLPSQAQLQTLLPLIGWPRVSWDGSRIRLPAAGMEIDFGGFGKEYAADRAATVLLDLGLEHGFINLGGDIRVIGPRQDGRPWSFGIQHPRQPDAVIASVALTTGALATSGDYERFFEQEGQRYCHILDVRTGWPVQVWAGVSVTAPACVAAGALTTIAMLKGEGAEEFLSSQGTNALMVSQEMSLTWLKRGPGTPFMEERW